MKQANVNKVLLKALFILDVYIDSRVTSGGQNDERLEGKREETLDCSGLLQKHGDLRDRDLLTIDKSIILSQIFLGKYVFITCL